MRRPHSGAADAASAPLPCPAPPPSSPSGSVSASAPLQALRRFRVARLGDSAAGGPPAPRSRRAAACEGRWGSAAVQRPSAAPSERSYTFWGRHVTYPTRQAVLATLATLATGPSRYRTAYPNAHHPPPLLPPQLHVPVPVSSLLHSSSAAAHPSATDRAQRALPAAVERQPEAGTSRESGERRESRDRLGRHSTAAYSRDVERRPVGRPQRRPDTFRV